MAFFFKSGMGLFEKCVITLRNIIVKSEISSSSSCVKPTMVKCSVNHVSFHRALTLSLVSFRCHKSLVCARWTRSA